eukprot:TRINITY_DN40891_c0_g1_i1.p2 TRINITY_DN40891_c0_g1~~TRINITY_DN40891_c0_g1_i1.p2  ORF type:complete len:112 (-),score=10.25 TRINITY_DN40891_c0_g1_i1:380-715(-)
MPIGAGASTLRRATQQQQRQQRHRNREHEDPPPAKTGGNRAADKRAKPAAAPGTNDPETHRPLPRPTFIPGFNQRQRRRHNAGRREPLQDATGDKQTRPLRRRQKRAADNT